MESYAYIETIKSNIHRNIIKIEQYYNGIRFVQRISDPFNI